MNYKKAINFFLGISFLGSILGYVLSDSMTLKFCRTLEYCDSTILGEYIGLPMLAFGLSFFIVFFTLFFLQEQIFRSWFRFTKWYLPIAVVLILISSDSGGGFFIGFGGGYDREGMILFTSGLFLIISLILIAVKSWKLRKGGTQM